MTRLAGLALVLWMVLGWAGLACAAEKDVPSTTGGETIRVATRVLEPFVMVDNGRLTGFSIELWEKIAERIGVRTEFDVRTTLPELLGSVEDGRDALAVAAISITAQREARFDFSHPIFDSGLAILVAEGASELDILGLLVTWSEQIMPALGVGLILILVAAHLVWLSERRAGESAIPMARSYFPGIFLTIYWVATLVGGQAEGMPRRPISRIIAATWIYVGLVFVAYFTAFATSSMTIQQLKTGISSPGDLAGKRVAAVEGSTGAKYLAAAGIETVNFPNVGEAVKALVAKNVVAVVYDSPILKHYANKVGQGRLRIAGPDFRLEKYGILFPQGSTLRKKVNEQLLALREDGTYLDLQNKWFGGSR